MIDLHCHILPGIDDGAEVPEDSLDMANAAVAAGTTTLVATPHVSWDWPDNDATTIAELVREISSLLRARGTPLQVLAGAEVALVRALDLPDEDLAALRLGGGPWLLLECPLTSDTLNIEAGIEALRERGHEHLLLAHPERIAAFHRDPALLMRLIDAGARTSCTAEAFAGRFGRTVAGYAREMLEEGLVHSVASDAHSAVVRPPVIRAPLEGIGLEAGQIEWLTIDVPQAMLAGDELPSGPPMVLSRRGRWVGRLRGR